MSLYSETRKTKREREDSKFVHNLLQYKLSQLTLHALLLLSDEELHTCSPDVARPINKMTYFKKHKMSFKSVIISTEYPRKQHFLQRVS